MERSQRIQLRGGRRSASWLVSLVTAIALWSLTAACLLSMSGCGGGSAGTGIETKTIEGTIRSTEDAPLAGVVITVTETGDSTVSNASGEFSIQTAVSGSVVELAINGETVDSSLQLNVSDNSTTVNLAVTVDEATSSLELKNVEVLTGVVGACNFAFENHRVIRQGNRLSPGTVCTVKSVVMSNGEPLRGIEILLQRKGCAPNSPWLVESRDKTRSSGAGQVNFTYFDDPDHCEYRIVTPYNHPLFNAVVTYIRTFQAQELLP